MVSIHRPCRRGVAALVAVVAACVLATAAHAADTLRATLDRDVVREGDTVRLTLSASGDGDVGRLDLAPLAADFEVLGTQQRQSVSVVNGRLASERELEVLLSPRRSGDLTIPALQAGAASSAPVALQVLDAASSGGASAARAGATGSGAASAVASGDAPDLFVEATADQTQPFVQGEVRYTVRVYDGVGIREGALTEPAADGVRIEPRGDTRNYKKVVNGRRYVVHEREYALIPQQSGELTVPPVVLQARVADPRQGAERTPFDDGDSMADEMFAEMFARMRAGGAPFGSSLIDRMMGGGREVRVRSNPVQLSVQGRPADAGQGWFLPARSVELSQSWQPAHPTFRVGEAVRRTIVLRAEGAAAAQLPKLEAPSVDGIRQYAADAQPGTEPHHDGVAAEAVHTFEVVPTRAGTFTLPAIEVPWWDVEARQARTATLPAQTIEVAAAPGSAQQQASAQAASKTVSQAAAGAAQPHTEPASAGLPASAATAPLPSTEPHATLGALLARPAGAAGAVALVLLLVTTTWWLARRTRASHATASPDASRTAPHATPRALVDALHQACTANDARAARDALVAWGRAQWPQAAPAGTGEIARRLGHPALVRAVKQLDDALYAPRAAGFDGAVLWREFRAARKEADDGAATTAEPLPALYPSSRVV